MQPPTLFCSLHSARRGTREMLEMHVAQSESEDESRSDGLESESPFGEIDRGIDID